MLIIRVKKWAELWKCKTNGDRSCMNERLYAERWGYEQFFFRLFVLRLCLVCWACEGLTDVSVVASHLLCVCNESWDVGGGGRDDLQVRPLCFCKLSEKISKNRPTGWPVSETRFDSATAYRVGYWCVVNNSCSYRQEHSQRHLVMILNIQWDLCAWKLACGLGLRLLACQVYLSRRSNSQ